MFNIQKLKIILNSYIGNIHRSKRIRLISSETKGFSTLYIVIILGGIAMTLALTLSMSSVWSLRSSNNIRISNQTKDLVNACAEVALGVIRENNNYTGSNTVTLNNDSCDYTVSNTGGTTRNIVISGTINGITRNLNINTGSFNPLVISSWQENI